MINWSNIFDIFQEKYANDLTYFNPKYNGLTHRGFTERNLSVKFSEAYLTAYPETVTWYEMPVTEDIKKNGHIDAVIYDKVNKSLVYVESKRVFDKKKEEYRSYIRTKTYDGNWTYGNGLYRISIEPSYILTYTEFGMSYDTAVSSSGEGYVCYIKQLNDGLFAFMSDYDIGTLKTSDYVAPSENTVIATLLPTDMGQSSDIDVDLDYGIDDGIGCYSKIYSNGAIDNYSLAVAVYSDLGNNLDSVGTYDVTASMSGVFENLNVKLSVFDDAPSGLQIYFDTIPTTTTKTPADILSETTLYDADSDTNVPLNSSSVTVVGMPASLTVAGDYDITVTYKGVTETTTLEIRDPNVVYSIGAYSPSGFCYLKGTSADSAFNIQVYNYAYSLLSLTCTISGYDPNKVGAQLVTFECSGVETKQVVYVYESIDAKKIVSVGDFCTSTGTVNDEFAYSEIIAEGFIDNLYIKVGYADYTEGILKVDAEDISYNTDVMTNVSDSDILYTYDNGDFKVYHTDFVYGEDPNTYYAE